MWFVVLVWTGIRSNVGAENFFIPGAERSDQDRSAGKLHEVAADLIRPVGVGTGNKRYFKLMCPFNNILCRIGTGTQFNS